MSFFTDERIVEAIRSLSQMNLFTDERIVEAIRSLSQMNFFTDERIVEAIRSLLQINLNENSEFSSGKLVSYSSLIKQRFKEYRFQS